MDAVCQARAAPHTWTFQNKVLELDVEERKPQGVSAA